MREFNLLVKYPQLSERVLLNRTIEHRILASYRGMDFFDGARFTGYGGMNYDGRWKPTAEFVIQEYAPKKVIQFASEKGFLLKELDELGVEVVGVDSSSYARSRALVKTVPALPTDQLVPFDLALGLGVVYTLPLDQAMNCIRKMEQVAHKAFITLAAYETQEDYWLFKQWTLLGCTILKKDEWIEVLKHCGYTGDYWFVNAKYLRLKEA